MRMHDARVGGHRRGSPQLERRPSSLGLDHACRCIANCKPPCAPPFALGVELRGPPRGGMRIPRFLQGAREGCLKSSRPARYPSGRCSVCQLPALFSSRGSSLHRWGTVARKESCIFCGRTAFTPCRRAHPQPSIRAGGEDKCPKYRRGTTESSAGFLVRARREARQQVSLVF